jgi:hypothetical protein
MTKMTIDLPTEFKNQVKANAAITGEKLKDYVISALKEKMDRDRVENKYLGELASRIDREGYLGGEVSDELLQNK